MKHYHNNDFYFMNKLKLINSIFTQFKNHSLLTYKWLAKISHAQNGAIFY
jgi:hypothetical protein